MDFGIEYINVFYHYKVDIRNLSKVKKRMLLKQINTFSSSPFLCELMIDYTIDFIILSSQFDLEFMSKNNSYMLYEYGNVFYSKMHNAKVDDKRLKNLTIRLLLLEKVCW